MAARLHEADAGAPGRIEACVKRRTAAALAMRVDQRSQRSIYAGMCERIGNEPALPFAIRVLAIALDRAAAARAVIGTERRLAFRRRRDDVDKSAGLAADLGGNRVARDGIGNEDVAVIARRNAFAALAEPFDGQHMP